MRARPVLIPALIVVLTSVALAPAAAAAPAPAGEVANPMYAAWAAFKPGSWQKTTSVAGGRGRPPGVPLDVTHTLVELTADHAVVETTERSAAPGDKPQTTRATLPAKLPADTPGLVPPAAAGGTEQTQTLTVAGQPILCRVTERRVRLGRGPAQVIRTWSSDAVPGGQVKEEWDAGATQTTTTLVAYEAK